MEIKELQALYARTPKVKALGRLLVQQDLRELSVCGLKGSSLGVVFSALSISNPDCFVHPILFAMDDEEQAGYLYQDIVQMLGTDGVCFLPSSFKRAIKFGQRDAANEILRTDVLSRLGQSQRPLLIISYPAALAQQVVGREQLSKNTLTLHRGEEVDITFVQETLLSYGFRRTDYVYEPGEFAVRGSLIDVYSFSNDHPFRIDFFGDEVDSIRTFDVENQLSMERLNLISIVPELEAVKTSRQCILDFIPEDTLLVMRDRLYLCENIDNIYHEGFSKAAEIVDKEEKQTSSEELKVDKQLTDPTYFRHRLLDFRTVLIDSNGSRGSKSNVTFNTFPQPLFHKNFDMLASELKRLMGEGYQIFILSDSEKQTDRLESIFHDKQQGVIFTPVDHTLHEGYIDSDRHVALFTDHQIFDRFHKYNLQSQHTRRGKMALTLKELQEFHLGDYVVHIDHGVGRFGGLVQVPEGGQMVEKIRINYDGGGIVYVSIHALHKISKYKGQEGTPPKVNKLGTGAWQRVKERTKSKLKDIARDLIKLYSRRRSEKGFAFSPDTYMQTELEASFLYEDTPDQSKATQDVKADMEHARPMDRLVCGDVGFGKTEIAVRAACKACADGKQVAVLVPTTVLAYQHYHTFQKRLKDMPIRVEYLSRARTAKETSQLLRDLQDGKVNILIGTHRLIGKSVHFQDLGLLIIDEEQKFGVSTKERLRQMKTNIDTLTLTATPIPRTLQFSLMGARDLSVIQTPPPNRYPIQTQLCTFSAETISEAINFEMSRSGQTFIISNRISSLPELEQIVHKYVPDARVAVGHGQMPPEKLEEIIMGFAHYDYDVLISTTIIESGLDMPRANTIIICSAQNFGLSDLHQMRGRVGRSNRKAFCYLLSPPLSSLNQDARRRLQAIETFSDLGSGIHIAMQDLDIRGAGNLLGAEQSGFIADLGYETYQKILSQAVHELRDEEFQDLYREQIKEGALKSGEDFVDDCQLDTDITAHLPEDYVPTSSERMLLYRQLDQSQRPEQIEEFKKQIEDRFGTMPDEAKDLCRLIRMRQLGRQLGAERIIFRQNRLRLIFVSNLHSAYYQSEIFGRIIDFCLANPAHCQIKEVKGQRSLIIDDVIGVSGALQYLETISAVQSSVNSN